MENKIGVVSRAGRSFEIDISNEACSKFGFKHGDRIRLQFFSHRAQSLIFSLKGTVMGVASPNNNDQSTLVLWLAIDAYGGKVVYTTDLSEIIRA